MNNRLLPHHLEDLRHSGMNDETIDILGFYSGTASQVKQILGFDAGPGLVIPYPCEAGDEPFCRVKPDCPLVINGGAGKYQHSGPAKYLSPRGARVKTYIPPRTRKALKDPKARFTITEGEKKAAKADQDGFACIGLGGIWGFASNHRLIPDLEEIGWEGRDVFLAPDSDYETNPHVKLAVFTLERWLTAKGALVLVIRIPAGDNGSKAGLDDFLIANSPDALRHLMSKAEPALFWEIHDLAELPENRRAKSLRELFNKFVALDPIELAQWRKLCKEKLGIASNEFKEQVKVTKERKNVKSSTIEAQVEQNEGYDVKQEPDSTSAILSEKVAELLNDPALLYRVGGVIYRLGVAGEEENIRLVYLAITSRIIENPISITLKGESSSGKSYIADKVRELFPPSAYVAMTGMSRQALVYTQESYKHRTVIIFERPGTEAADYNIRTLQSEGRIVFETVVKDPETNRMHTERIEKEGPTNFIFTTTSPLLHPENESRHWSLAMDESVSQTLAAKVETARRYEADADLAEEELVAWRQMQPQLEPRRVRIPYARWLAEHTPTSPLRMRRDFNKLMALIEVIALLHQHQRTKDGNYLVAGLADYFIARELVDNVFQSSLAGINKKVEGLIAEVHRLYVEKLNSGDGDPLVRPTEIVRALGTSSSSVSRWLRPAIEAGLIEVETETAKGRIKAVKPGYGERQLAGTLPTVEQLANAFPELAKDFRVVHPVTGEELALAVEEPSEAEENCEIPF